MHQDQSFQITKAFTRASDRMNAKTFEFNNQPKYRGKNLFLSPALMHSYDQDYAALFTKILNEELDKEGILHSDGETKVICTDLNGTKVWKVVTSHE
jgi:hypothetical protein